MYIKISDRLAGFLPILDTLEKLSRSEIPNLAKFPM